MPAYYNEIDPHAAAWLRELISKKLIAPGDVDERSIEDVTPDEIRNYTQCHFFAGIGTWSYALRGAGWDDDRPIWTGSCPCQPFSAAGKGGGVDDERHLWPHWHHLIHECRPFAVLGEQVASKDGLAWFDIVSSDMEGTGYAIGANDLCAAGFGAPHIRQRLFFGAYDTRYSDGAVGHPDCARLEVGGGKSGKLPVSQGREAAKRSVGLSSISGGVAIADGRQCNRGADAAAGDNSQRKDAGWPQGDRGASICGEAGGDNGGPGPTNGSWKNADWLLCRDGKWRCVEPGTFPLVDGPAARVVRLRGYGNGIAEPVARGFCELFRLYLDQLAA